MELFAVLLRSFVLLLLLATEVRKVDRLGRKL